jgi:uncharacterized membrane protein
VKKVKPSILFIAVAAVGVAEALYHAWLENAFVTNIFVVNYAPFASFFGVPYWLFGVVWFPVILVIGLWSTRLGTARLNQGLLALLTVGNLFTVYLWYLDLLVVRAYTIVYVVLYVTNYVLTGIVVLQNWSIDAMRGFVYGTIIGTVVGAALGALFGPFAVAACGVGGGILGAIRNYVLPKEPSRAPVDPR